jgi:hypothetical protein
MSNRIDVHELQERERLAPCLCGERFGRHRWETLACPNPGWKVGNGQPQWLTCGFQFRDASTYAVLP